MTTLHYTGTEEIVFMTGNVGPVEPGADFDVPDDLAEAFLTRSDVEPAGDPPARPPKPPKPPKPANANTDPTA